MNNFQIQSGINPEQQSTFEPLLSQAREIFGVANSPLGQARLLESMKARQSVLHLNTLAEYGGLLNRDPQEWARLWPRALPWSGAFLHPLPLFEVATELLMEWAVMAQKRVLRVLSLGCGSGFETTSLSMLIEKAGLPGKNWQVDIYGLDINPQALTVAGNGIFTAEDLEWLPENLGRKWFYPRGGGFHLRSGVGAPVHFSQANAYEVETWSWPEPESESVPEPETESRYESEYGYGYGYESRYQSRPESESRSRPESAPRPQPRPESRPEPEPQPSPESEPESEACIKTFDLIFCRELTFDAPPRSPAKLAQILDQVLSATGLIFTAPGEFLPLDQQKFSLEERQGVTYYRRGLPQIKTNRRHQTRRQKAGRTCDPLPSPSVELAPLSPREQHLLEAAETELRANDFEKARALINELLYSALDQSRPAPEAWEFIARLEKAQGRLDTAQAAQETSEAY